MAQILAGIGAQLQALAVDVPNPGLGIVDRRSLDGLVQRPINHIWIWKVAVVHCTIFAAAADRT